MSTPAITIDRQKCMGTGLCTVYAAATFAHDEDAKAVVSDPNGNSADDIQTAIEACPTGAISLATAG
ncbi:MAG TPA: ferredoxin [Mycobacteriales bacterium]|nr:ferredoxin [Mycobacteriales bacterium]